MSLLPISRKTCWIVYLLVIHCSLLLVIATTAASSSSSSSTTRLFNSNDFFASLDHWRHHGRHQSLNHLQRHSVIHATTVSALRAQDELLPQPDLEHKRFDLKRNNNPFAMGRNLVGSLLARAVNHQRQQRCHRRRRMIQDPTTITTSCSSLSVADVASSSASALPNNNIILASSSTSSTLSAPRPRFNNAIFRFLGGRKLATRTSRQQQAGSPPSSPAVGSSSGDGIVVETFVQDATSVDDDALVLKAITQPIIPQNIWERLTGREFQDHPHLVDELAQVGEDFARSDAPNHWVNWLPNGDTLKGNLQEGDIHVWTGKCQSCSKNNQQQQQQGYGTSVPWIKTRSIVPMSPQEMAELLLDSSRVKTYNAWSTGRKDMWKTNDGFTKIVKNKTQPPVVGSKAVVGVTLLHARPLLHEPGSWIVVSRAVGGTRFYDAHGEEKGTGKSDILLGVNLLQPVPGDEDSSILTAVTHAYSAGVPTMLAERLGVKSAIKFVKDMRALKKPAYVSS